MIFVIPLEVQPSFIDYGDGCVLAKGFDNDRAIQARRFAGCVKGSIEGPSKRNTHTLSWVLVDIGLGF